MKAKEEYTAKVEKMKKSSDVLRYQDIPWPCEGTVQDMVDVMLADAKEGFQILLSIDCCMSQSMDCNGESVWKPAKDNRAKCLP